jgi:hypothetical protein
MCGRATSHQYPSANSDGPYIHAKMNPSNLPEGYIFFSEAIRRLQKNMRGGLRGSVAVAKLRDELKKPGNRERLVKVGPFQARSGGPEWPWQEKAQRGEPSVGYGCERQRAGRCMTEAAVEGKLSVYVAQQDQPTRQVTVVPSCVLGRLIRVRGSLLDHVVRRPSLKACEGDENLFLLLKTGCLVVEEKEFARWLKTEYRKGKWPSQRSRKARTGRPTKQTKDLSDVVVRIVREGLWSGRQPITELQRQLMAAGRDDVPSADTLARLVDRLHEETGDPDFYRELRSRRSK